MLRSSVSLIALAVVVVGCAPAPAPPIIVEPLPEEVSFLEDVKPVLDSRCVVCHSCYNAACQLKLSSYEGIDRGGSKQSVYSSSRLKPQAPSRLFHDAKDTKGWRKRGTSCPTSSSPT